MRTLFASALAVLAVPACSNAPAITNASVTPNSFQISGLASNAQFTITTDVLHFGGTVTAVTATVENESALGPYNLTQSGSVAGGESWSVTTTLTLPSGFADGTYKLDITVKDSDGTSVTQADAAQLTISG